MDPFGPVRLRAKRPPACAGGRSVYRGVRSADVLHWVVPGAADERELVDDLAALVDVVPLAVFHGRFGPAVVVGVRTVLLRRVVGRCHLTAEGLALDAVDGVEEIS